MNMQMLTMTTGWKDQFLREIRTKADDRAKESAEFLRRTIRQVVGIRAPNKRIKSGPGEVPYMVSGTMKRNIDKKPVPGGYLVTITAYGMEAGLGKFTGKPHPALAPTFAANVDTMAAIQTGEIGAPRFGDMSCIGNRKAEVKKTKKEIQNPNGFWIRKNNRWLYASPGWNRGLHK